MASGSIKAVVPKSDIVDNLTTNDSTKVLSAAQGYSLNGNIGALNALATGNMSSIVGAINSLAARVDTSGTMQTFAESVKGGTFQYFRNRTGEPSSSWNYSVGIVFAPTDNERVVVMFEREAGAIAMKAKYGGSWTGWKTISLQ